MPENRRIVLLERPEGAVNERTFRQETQAVPALADGELLVKTLCLSIDPTIRGWIARDTYLPAVKLGEVVRSGGIGEVVESRNAAFKTGDRVFGLLGWQEYSVHGAKAALNQVPAAVPITDALGVLGATGITAYFGLLEIGKPEAGETVVVSGAAGATGSVAGQIAKLRGCRVIGIAGRADKCRWITEELGFDAAIDYKAENVGKRIFETCPKGVDVFFDNVGGPILDAVLANLALRARVVLCGAISQYNQLDAAYGPKNYVNLIGRRARMEGFIVLDYRERYMEAIMQLAGWVSEGKIKHKVNVLEGLESAPEALQRLFSGDHDGKLLVKLG